MQHFQCWCYSYPTSTCLTTNTLTSARVTSVLTHFIKSEDCSVCETDFPRVKEIVDENNYTSYYIQADEITEAVGQLNLYTAPVVILFYNGKEIHRQARFIDFSELDYRIKQTL